MFPACSQERFIPPECSLWWNDTFFFYFLFFIIFLVRVSLKIAPSLPLGCCRLLRPGNYERRGCNVITAAPLCQQRRRWGHAGSPGLPQSPAVLYWPLWAEIRSHRSRRQEGHERAASGPGWTHLGIWATWLQIQKGWNHVLGNGTGGGGCPRGQFVALSPERGLQRRRKLEGGFWALAICAGANVPPPQL